MPNRSHAISARVVMLGAALLVALLLVFPSAGQAQEVGQLTGTVSDSSSGQGIPGAQVLVVGSTLGAVTGADGRYTIARVPAGGHSVQVRRVGYSPRTMTGVTVASGATVTLDVALRSAPLQLEAVVTTGVVDPTSGTRVPFTVGRVDMENAPVPATNAVETLQGKIAGATIVGGGQPGGGTNLLLRTPASINKSTFPLVVVDGVILSQSFDGSTADLEALDIESIEVVKGAAAASLYGSRAANGVIQIRTRRGAGLTAGNTQVTVRSEIGTNEIANKIDWAKHHFYQTDETGWYTDADGNQITPGNVDSARLGRIAKPAASQFQDSRYGVPIYDQVESFFDPGQFYKNSINIAQNSGKTNWFLSLINSREDGVVLGNGGYEQNDVRLNLDHRPTENLSISFSGYHMRSTRDGLYGDTFFDLINQAPDVNLAKPDADGTPYEFQGDPEGREENPLYVLSTEQDETSRARTQGSLEGRYAPFSWLSLDANVSYDRSDRRRKFFLDQGFKTEGFPEGGPGEIEQFSGTTDALNAAMSANLLQRIGVMTVRATARGLMERESNDLVTAEGRVFAVPGVPSLDNVQERFVESSIEDIRSNGFFVTAGADYDGRYIVDGLFRRDGSSLFGPEERWNSYYRVSGAYRMSQEAWWPFPAVNEFKLRASQGTAGGRPDFEDQFETYSFTTGGGLVKETLGNKFLKPELATETELGVDMIVNDRYSLQLSYARSRVEDQLVAIPLAGMFGYTSQWQNAGTVEGNTFEATVEAQIVRSPTLSWRMGLVADRTRNKITEFDRSCFTTNTIAYRCAGETLGAMYGFSFAKSTSDLPADAQARAAEFQRNDDGILVWVGPNATYKQGETYVDPETEKVGLWGSSTAIGTTTYGWGQPITVQDETGAAAVVRIGDGNPDFHFGVSNNVTWKDFSFYALVDAQVGGNVYHQTKQRMYQWGRSADVDQVGKAQELKKPVGYYSALYAANSPTDWFVEDGGFVKLREVSLAYRVPDRMVRKLGNVGVDQMRFSVVGRNLLTFTDYTGYDPEVGGTINRLDSFSYPRYRTVTGTVEITF
ncbi:MAG: SusC/RagA family TonB-linked outer membrane protein [Gemmatimonadaceae bacterium]